jgi:hypothetical protein
MGLSRPVMALLYLQSETRRRKSLALVPWDKLQTTRSRVIPLISFIVTIAQLQSTLHLCHACPYSAPTGRIFVKFIAADFYKIVCRKSKFRYNLTKISDNLLEYPSRLNFSHHKEIFYSLATVKRGKYCRISMATFSICILFTALNKSTEIRRERIHWILRHSLEYSGRSVALTTHHI